MTDDNETNDEIESAIEQVTDDEPNPEEPGSEDETPGGNDDESGLLGDTFEMSGTGKPLSAYEDSPYRSLAGGTAGDVDADELRHKGELHLARGVDGLLGGIVDAGHPFVDLAIGGFLLMVAGRGDGSGDSDGYDGSDLGNETMSDTPADDLTTGDS